MAHPNNEMGYEGGTSSLRSLKISKLLVGLQVYMMSPKPKFYSGLQGDKQHAQYSHADAVVKVTHTLPQTLLKLPHVAAGLPALTQALENPPGDG